MFKLHKPCAKCPFRTDVPGYLSRARANEIVTAITTKDAVFWCHETTVASEEDDGDMVATKSSQHCAGATILLEKIDRPNQMMRICERIRQYDRTKMDMAAPVFDTPRQFVAHHGGRR